MLKKLACVALLAASSFCSQAANSAASGDPATFGFNTNGSALSSLGTDIYPGVFEFLQFDDMRGTLILNSIELILTGTVTGTVTAFNGSADDITINRLELEAEISVNGATLSSPLITTTPVANFRNIELAAGATFSDSSLSGTSFNTEFYLPSNSAVFGLFIGTGTEELTVEALGLGTYTGPSFVNPTFSTFAFGDLQVIYNYSPAEVSEPGYLAALGLTLIALGNIRRRKSK
jgi:hypothetical protein